MEMTKKKYLYDSLLWKSVRNTERALQMGSWGNLVAFLWRMTTYCMASRLSMSTVSEIEILFETGYTWPIVN